VINSLKARERLLPKSAELYTYSASTAARATLLAARFFAAQGIGTGSKLATTIAFATAQGVPYHPAPPRLMGTDWLTRWRRSHAKFPPALSNEARFQFEKLIETHCQFLNEDISRAAVR